MSVPVVSYRRREEKSRGGDGLYGAIAVTALPLVGALASNRQVVQDSRVVSILSVHPFAVRFSISINRFDTQILSRDVARRLFAVRARSDAIFYCTRCRRRSAVQDDGGRPLSP